MSGIAQNVHPWLQKIHLSYIPGQTTPLLQRASADLVEQFRKMGHTVQDAPEAQTKLILTTAPFGKALDWREALLFNIRRRFGLKHTPTIITMIHARPAEFQKLLDHFEAALQKKPLEPSDFSFPGLASTAHRTLIEQGLRGGAMLSLERLLQAQCKSIRILLFIGEDSPQAAYHFDLVGAYPRSEAKNKDAFYEDIVLRMVTTLSTEEVTQHQVVGERISNRTWKELSTPAAMRVAAQELGRRDFFTQMVRISDLVHVPAVGDVIAEQYSEGCFTTWDIQLNALISTITGSARPVKKDNITEAELAIIVGIRPDLKGALVQHVEGRENDPPSSEAVEMMALDQQLPKIKFSETCGKFAATDQVPVVRSKLHGHRGVSAYHPDYVEYTPLDPAYFYYPVSCATEAQARGIQRAFSRSEALIYPADPRQVIFTILPGHGVVIVEKWQLDKIPFQLMWEYMDAGHLQINSQVPQGPLTFALGADGRMYIKLLLN